MTEENPLKSGTKQGKVGYKNPPKEYQFKKGENRNPKGRGLGVKNFATIFKEAIKKIAKEKSIKELDVEVDLVIRAIAEARGGNYQYYRDIFDRVYGQAKANIEHSGSVSVQNIEIKSRE